MTAPELITPDTLAQLMHDGLTATAMLEADYSHADAATAEAVVAAELNRQATEHGFTARRDEITYTATPEPTGLFGTDDPYRRITLTGRWRLTLPGARAVLHHGPAHGRTHTPHPARIFEPITYRAVAAADLDPGDVPADLQLKATEAVYTLTGYQPATRALIYTHHPRTP